jgi:hypothetical protein
VEISYKTPKRNLAKFNIFIGIVFIIFFWIKIQDFSTVKFIIKHANQYQPDQDILTLLVIGFSIFSILVSSFTILDIKPRGSKT